MRPWTPRKTEPYLSALHAAFVRERRTKNARLYFVGALLGGSMVVAFAIALTFILRPRSLLIAHLSCAWIALVAALYASFTRSDRFPDARYAELGVNVAMLPGELGFVYALSLDEDIIGWPAHTVLFDIVIILVSYSTFAFLTNFRAFALWLAVLVPVYVASLFAIGVPVAPMTINLLSVLSLISLAALSNWTLSRQGLANFQLESELRGEKEKSERLLHTLVPADIAERLKRGESVADPFPAATVAFVDIVGSSAFARQVSPDEFVATLDAIFAIADRHAQLHKVEKVKTIGDAYLVVAGARGGGDAVGAVQFALGVIRDVAAFAARRELAIGIRAGLHTGPVIGGVIGSQRSIYDYWGDTMNTAARLESAARPNAIAVSEPVYRAVSRVAAFDPPRMVQLKGIGDFAVYDHVPELW